MAGLTATFRAARREFWLFDDRSGLCHCGEVRRRLCLPVQGVLEIFSAPSRATAYLVLEFGVHRCGGLGEDVQSDSAEVHYVRLSCLWKIFAGAAKVRVLALRNAGGQSSLDPHPCGRPCRVAKMFSLAFDSRRGLPSKNFYFFLMQRRKAHLQCKCSWHTHTGSLVTHAAPSRSQTSRGTSPEAGTMTKKLLHRVHASLSFFFFFYQISRCWKTSSSSSCCSILFDDLLHWRARDFLDNGDLMWF